MLGRAGRRIRRQPVLFPALVIAGAVLGFNFLGDALRDQLDPRTRLELGL
jgi:peptide/nickel transport system permease protein